MPVPGNIDELIDVARRLSLCIPRPYVRIDLYDIDGEVVFGELTPDRAAPSSNPSWTSGSAGSGNAPRHACSTT